VRHITGAHRSSMLLPINAATRVELRGDCNPHGWIQHGFESKMQPSFQLVARARQFYIDYRDDVETEQGESEAYHYFDKYRSREQALIPLLTNALPSAKEFNMPYPHSHLNQKHLPVYFGRCNLNPQCLLLA